MSSKTQESVTGSRTEESASAPPEEEWRMGANRQIRQTMTVHHITTGPSNMYR